MTQYKKLIFTIFTRVGNTGFGALSAVLIAANFGEYGLGIFALIRTLPMFLMIFTEMGVSHSYSYLINAKGINRNTVLFNGLTFGVLVGIVQVIIWIIISPLLISQFSINIDIETIQFVAGVAPLMVFQLNFVNYLRAVGRIYLANLQRIAVEFFIALFFFIVWFYNLNNIELLIYGILTAYLLVSIFTLLFFVKNKYIIYTKFDIAVFRQSISFGLKSQLGNAFQILNYRLDQIIVGFLIGPSMLGVYVVATKAAELFRFFSLSIVFVLEPVISRKSRSEALLLVKKYYKPLLLTNSMIIIVGCYIGPKLIPIFFDSWSTESVFPFYILMIGLLFTGSNGLIGAFSLGQGKPWLITSATGFALIFTVSLDMFLIPTFGIVGAAIASTTGYLMSSFAYLYFFIKEGNQNEIVK